MRLSRWGARLVLVLFVAGFVGDPGAVAVSRQVNGEGALGSASVLDRRIITSLAKAPGRAGGVPEREAARNTYPGGTHGSSDGEVIRLGGLVLDMVLTEEFIYALHEVTQKFAPGSYRTQDVAVSRVDRQTHEVVRGDVLPVTFDLALAGGWLWVYNLDYDEAGNHCAVLHRIDPGTLRVVDEIELPEPPPVKAGTVKPATVDEPTPYDDWAMDETPDGRDLWVTLGRHLHRIDGRTGRILQTAVSEEMIATIAVDPRSRHFYAFSYDDYRVTKRDIENGDVLRRSNVLEGTGFQLTAANQGVWVGGLQDGATAEVRLLDDDDLRSRRRAGSPGRNFHLGAVANDTLWVMSDEAPAGRDGRMWLFCADASNGRLRVQEPQGKGAANIVGDQSALYASSHDGLPDEQGIAVVHADPTCTE